MNPEPAFHSIVCEEIIDYKKHSMSLLKYCSPFPLATGIKRLCLSPLDLNFLMLMIIVVKKGTWLCQLLSSIT